MTPGAALSVVQPLMPRVDGWREVPVPAPVVNMGYPCRMFVNLEHGIQVISGVEVAIDAPGMEPNGPEYHISISQVRHGRTVRIRSVDADRVLIQFGLEGAKEDNHVPSGLVRNYWRPVAEPKVGLVCACQADEPAIREDKGDFVWRPAP